MSTYIDSSAFLAIVNLNDDKHQAAVAAWGRLIDAEEMMVTSNYVVVETISLLHARHGIAAVRFFAEDILSMILIEWVDAQTHANALSALLASSGKQGPSIVDCTSFEVIHRSGIGNVFVYDRHFADRGLNLVGE